MTLQQVGDVFGISAASVSSWERGTNFPDPRKLAKLALTLGVSVDELVSSEQETIGLKSFEVETPSKLVPFVSWQELSNWPHIKAKVCECATLLHHPNKLGLFATRFAGLDSCTERPLMPPTGAIIFIDPEREPSVGRTSLIMHQGKPEFVTCLRGERGIKRVILIESGKDLFFNSNNEEFIGSVIEWQISGVFN